MSGFARDLRYALRSLARMRAVAVLAIATLGLGIGATTTMFSVVDAMLLRAALRRSGSARHPLQHPYERARISARSAFRFSRGVR
jgi:hypothetical protein